jgi:hypothetical protein
VLRFEAGDVGTFDAEKGKRLFLAIEEDAGWWPFCTTSVHNYKNNSEWFRFRAVITEEGSQMLFLED